MKKYRREQNRNGINKNRTQKMAKKTVKSTNTKSKMRNGETIEMRIKNKYWCATAVSINAGERPILPYYGFQTSTCHCFMLSHICVFVLCSLLMHDDDIRRQNWVMDDALKYILQFISSVPEFITSATDVLQLHLAHSGVFSIKLMIPCLNIKSTKIFRLNTMNI